MDMTARNFGLTLDDRRFNPTNAALVVDQNTTKAEIVSGNGRYVSLQAEMNFFIGNRDETVTLKAKLKITPDGRGGLSTSITLAPFDKRDAKRTDALCRAIGSSCDKSTFIARISRVCANTPDESLDRMTSDIAATWSDFEAIARGIGQRRNKSRRLPRKLDVTRTVVGAITSCASRDRTERDRHRDQLNAIGRHRIVESREKEVEFRQLMKRTVAMAEMYQKMCNEDPTLKAAVVSMMREAHKSRSGKPSRLDKALASEGAGPHGVLAIKDIAQKEWRKKSKSGPLLNRRYDEDKAAVVLESVYKRMDEFERAFQTLSLGVDLTIEQDVQQKAHTRQEKAQTERQQAQAQSKQQQKPQGPAVVDSSGRPLRGEQQKPSNNVIPIDRGFSR